MSSIKNWLYDLEQEREENEPELDDLLKYELYCLFHEMKEKGINTDFFEPLMGEDNE